MDQRLRKNSMVLLVCNCFKQKLIINLVLNFLYLGSCKTLKSRITPNCTFIYKPQKLMKIFGIPNIILFVIYYIFQISEIYEHFTANKAKKCILQKKLKKNILFSIIIFSLS